MPLMSLPYVTDVSFKDGKIVLTIQLEKDLANESVEISGYATQTNGAFATFYDIQSAKENPAGKVLMFVKATPTTQFQTGEPVTVALRASRVWVTVLSEAPDGETTSGSGITSPPTGTAAQDGTTWNTVTAVQWASAVTWRAGQTSAGGDSSFRA
jgi:hypothetical protein